MDDDELKLFINMFWIPEGVLNNWCSQSPGV